MSDEGGKAMNTDNSYTVDELEAICKAAREGALEYNALNNPVDSGWLACPDASAPLSFTNLRYRPRPDPFEAWWSGLSALDGSDSGKYRSLTDLGTCGCDHDEARAIWDSITTAAKKGAR